MSAFERRDFLTSAAAFAAVAATSFTKSNQAQAGDSSFANNVPDPLLEGKDLPTFKFELEKSQG